MGVAPYNESNTVSKKYVGDGALDVPFFHANINYTCRGAYYVPVIICLKHYQNKVLHHGLRLFPGGFLALLSMDRLEHLGHQLHLGARRD